MPGFVKQNMKEQYSISDLEALSGIRAHTIRIWEQRYDLFHPSRTETNIRYYSDSDLKKLLNISTLQRYGWKISKLGNLSPEELNHELRKHISTNTRREDFIEDSINEIIISLIAMDESAFSSVFNWCNEKLGFENTVEQVVFPVLVKIGLMWNTSEIIPAQEHFISSLVKMKVAAATDNLQVEAKSSDKILLFTPENELHDLGLMLLNYLIRSKGINTVYLGQSVPFDNIGKACEITGCKSVLVGITIQVDPEKLSEYLKKLNLLPQINRIYVMAHEAVMAKVKTPSKLIWVQNPTQLDQHLFEIKSLPKHD